MFLTKGFRYEKRNRYEFKIWSHSCSSGSDKECNGAEKVYDTKSLSDYLKVGKSAIEKLRQDGELAYSKIGRTIVYTQSDVDALLRNNHVNYVR